MRSNTAEICRTQHDEEVYTATGRQDEPFDWLSAWHGCARRLRTWRVPPRWSAREWYEEMQAEAAIAALVAARDFQPDRNIPFYAYMKMRIMGQVLARYRKEWSYALRQASTDRYEEPGQNDGAERKALLKDEMVKVLGLLGSDDRRLIERLYWREETETEVARTMGLSQQAINKRKKSILNTLRSEFAEDSC